MALPRWTSFALALVMALGIFGASSGSNSASASGSGATQPTAVTCPGTPAQCFADVPPGNSFFDNANRIYMQGIVGGYPCGGAGEPCDADNRPYYRPGNGVTRQQMSKFVDLARRQPGIDIEDPTLHASDPPPIKVVISGTHAIWGETHNGAGVAGFSDTWKGVYGQSQSNDGVLGASNTGAGVSGTSTTWKGVAGLSTNDDGVYGYSAGWIGVDGKSDTGTGVLGESNSQIGVYGLSHSNLGVYGESQNGDGLKGKGTGMGAVGESTGGAFTAGVLGTSANSFGVWGSSTNSQGVYGSSTNGNAGYFQGNVTITGTCTGCAGPMKMDDPSDPANKYLYHTAVESPDMLNVYSGNITTDGAGEATVALPDYFEALNTDFRYQLTPLGQFAQAIVSQEIANNVFTIKTDKPNVKVSWQVTGVRNDPYAQQHPITPQVDKPASEQGTYLHPAEYGQPESKGVNYEQTQQMNAQLAAAQAEGSSRP
jgi:hypothetical protein